MASADFCRVNRIVSFAVVGRMMMVPEVDTPTDLPIRAITFPLTPPHLRDAPFGGDGLHHAWLAHPGVPRHMRFVFLGSGVWLNGLPSDPASRRRPCLCLCLCLGLATTSSPRDSHPQSDCPCRAFLMGEFWEFFESTLLRPRFTSSGLDLAVLHDDQRIAVPIDVSEHSVARRGRSDNYRGRPHPMEAVDRIGRP